jgi:hypothetical protein
MAMERDARDAISAFFVALNEPNPEEIARLSTTAGLTAVGPQLAAEPDRFAFFPALLEVRDRIGVRGMVAPRSPGQGPGVIWLGFRRLAGGWRCDAAFDDTESIEGWLKSETDPEESVRDAISAFSTALIADADALSAVVTPGAFDRSASPRRLQKQASPGVALAPVGPIHVAGDRAAAQVAWLVDGRPTDNVWLALHKVDGAFRVDGVGDHEAAAALFVSGALPHLPGWADLPDDDDARAVGERVLAKIGQGGSPEAGATAAVWDELIASPPAGLTPKVGEVRATPVRAMVQLGFFGPDDPEFAEDDRWILLEKRGTDWAILGVRYGRGIGSLLDGVAPAWAAAEPTAPAPSRAAPAPAPAMESRLKAILDQAGVKPGADGKADLSQVKSEDVAKAAPQILQELMGGFAAVLGGGAPPETPPEGVVDLAAERRARGQTAPLDAENELGDAFRSAIAGVVAQADGGSGQVNVDASFLKEKGPELATALFSAFAQAFIPKDLKVTVPAAGSVTEDPLADPLTAADRDAGQRTVDVHLDLGALLKGLVKPKNDEPRS